MKNLFLIYIFLSLFGCASRSDGLPSDVTLKIKINGVAYEEDFDLEYKDGLALLSSKTIEDELKIYSTRNAYSYVDKHNVQIEFPQSDKLIVFSSVKENEESRVTNYVIGFADSKHFKKTSFSFLGTEFSLISKMNSKISQFEFKSLIYKVWNAYQVKLGTSSDMLTFVETFNGPQGENVLGINYQENLVAAFSKEIAKTYFGFGLTREKVSSAKGLWFSYGMAEIYEREITRKLTGREPTFTTDVAFLKNLRMNLGIHSFDRAAKRYLQECSECVKGYQDFKRFLPGARYKINQIEKAFNI